MTVGEKYGGKYGPDRGRHADCRGDGDDLPGASEGSRRAFPASLYRGAALRDERHGDGRPWSDASDYQPAILGFAPKPKFRSEIQPEATRSGRKNRAVSKPYLDDNSPSPRRFGQKGADFSAAGGCESR